MPGMRTTFSFLFVAERVPFDEGHGVEVRFDFVLRGVMLIAGLRENAAVDTDADVSDIILCACIVNGYAVMVFKMKRQFIFAIFNENYLRFCF